MDAEYKSDIIKHVAESKYFVNITYDNAIAHIEVDNGINNSNRIKFSIPIKLFLMLVLNIDGKENIKQLKDKVINCLSIFNN